MLSSHVPGAEHLSKAHRVSLVPGHTSTLLYTSEPCVGLAHAIVQDLDPNTGQLLLATRASSEVLRKVTVVALSSGLQPPHTVYSQQVLVLCPTTPFLLLTLLSCSRLCSNHQCLLPMPLVAVPTGQWLGEHLAPHDATSGGRPRPHETTAKECVCGYQASLESSLSTV